MEEAQIWVKEKDINSYDLGRVLGETKVLKGAQKSLQLTSSHIEKLGVG